MKYKYILMSLVMSVAVQIFADLALAEELISTAKIQQTVEKLSSSQFCIVRARVRTLSHGFFDPTFLQILTFTCDGKETVLDYESPKEDFSVPDRLLSIAGQYFTASGFHGECSQKDACSFQRRDD